VARVNPAEAIAELKELSTQIESVTLVDRNGDVVASSVAAPQAGRVAAAATELVAGADELRADLGRDALAQVQAAMAEGSVFVVVDDRRIAVATTGADPTVGLVFYDLKTLLRQTESQHDDASAAPAEGVDEE
jgi:predicted regulator of Ras-like GTPase activity (Roadblock/LC7/MglB family)